MTDDRTLDLLAKMSDDWHTQTADMMSVVVGLTLLACDKTRISIEPEAIREMLKNYTVRKSVIPGTNSWVVEVLSKHDTNLSKRDA